MSGTLFVVATPIGNLEDLTFRALRTLKEVDVIAAEDTRRTSKLLAHYGVSRPLVSLHEHNEHREAPRLVQRLQTGESIALVTDAGTPGISDPGSGLVRAARQAGLPVVPVPGPSAVTAALSVSGLALPSFVFLGFPPAGGAARQRWFDALGDEPRVAVFFEAPHRITSTLSDARISCGKRPIIVNREITKLNEKLVIWNKEADHTMAEVPERGEFVVIVGQNQDPDSGGVNAPDYERVMTSFCYLTEQLAIEPEMAISGLSLMFGVPRFRIASLIKKAAIAAKRSHEA